MMGTPLSDTETVTVTITGTNDAPVITGGPDTSELTETDSGLTDSGTLTVGDTDKTDVVMAAVDSVAVSGTGAGSVPGTLTNLILQGYLTVSPTTILNGTQTSDTLTWDFNSGSEAFDFLATGETLILTYTVSATDDDGTPLSDTETVTVTITGTNDAPIITDGPDTSSLSETDAGLGDTGTLTISDVDLTDAVTAAVDSVAVGGTGAGSVPGSLSNAILQGFLTVSPTAILNGTETTDLLTWTFDSGAEAFDFLATGETLVLTYTILATDDDGAPLSDSETVTVTITGTNDGPQATNINAAESYTEEVAVNLADIVVSDVDDADITVTLTLSDVAAGALNAGTSGSVTSTFVGGVWNASGAVADVNTLLAALTFTPATDYDQDFSIATSVDDGEAAPITGVKNFTATALNDDPSNSGTAPADVAVIEDAATNVDLSGIDFADPDEANGVLRVTLATSSDGTLHAISSGGVTVGGSGTTAITLDGTLADLNAFIDNVTNIQFTGSQDAYGNDVDTISVTINDNGNSGSGGGGDVLLATINADITAVNDSPVIAGLGGDSVSVFNNGVAILIDVMSPASIDDAKDGTVDYDGGSLTLTGNSFDALDTLGVDVSGSISLSAGFTDTSVISVGGFAIGTLSGVTNDSATISFNAGATVARVDTLVQSFTFETISATLGARTLDLVINDADGISNGGSEASPTATVNIAVGLAGGGLVATDEDVTYTYDATDFDFTGITGTDLDTITITSLPVEGLATVERSGRGPQSGNHESPN